MADLLEGRACSASDASPIVSFSFQTKHRIGCRLFVDRFPRDDLLRLRSGRSLSHASHSPWSIRSHIRPINSEAPRWQRPAAGTRPALPDGTARASRRRGPAWLHPTAGFVRGVYDQRKGQGVKARQWPIGDPIGSVVVHRRHSCRLCRGQRLADRSVLQVVASRRRMSRDRTVRLCASLDRLTGRFSQQHRLAGGALNRGCRCVPKSNSSAVRASASVARYSNPSPISSGRSNSLAR